MNLPQANSTVQVKKLTKQTGGGEFYQRRPDAEFQIEKILTLEASQVLAVLDQSGSKNRGEAGYLLDETIVYLLREARLAGRSDGGQMFERLYLELNRRIWKLLAKFRGDFKTNYADFEDFGQRAGLTIVRKIFDLEIGAGDYAQVNFGDFVVSEAAGLWKRHLIKLMKEEKLFKAGGRQTDENEDGGNQLENLSAEQSELSADRRLIMREGLEKLSAEHRTVAAMLLDGFQIESKNAAEPTISKHLGVSSRTIRNWIKEMRHALEDYRGEARR